MSTKEEILAKVRDNIITRFDMPDRVLQAIEYPDKIAQFVAMTKIVGGEVHLLQANEDINQVIRELYPRAKVIASNLPTITIATMNPDEVVDCLELNNIDLAIVEGQIGVAENACVCIAQTVKHKAIYFIPEYLIMILDRDKIVNNMHEAYESFKFNDSGFSTFISGPSKTADIEQSLVVGAQGAKGVTVILK